jgi:bla regulator protein blaR1
MQMLLNWLWQGTALTILVALGLRVRPATNAATRERVWWVALVAVAVMPLAHALSVESRMDAVGVASAASDAAVMIRWTSADTWLMVIVGVWLAWGAVGMARLTDAWLQLHAARSSAAPFPSERESRLRVWTAVKGQGRPARLVVSPRVHRAAVLGGREPLIALAPRTLAELDDQELDRVVIHEYAHVQRRDDAAVVVQRLLSVVASLHPAVWWIDKAIETEREVACDDWVVTYTGGRSRYAASLVRLAIPAAAEAWIAPGAVTVSQLRIRVARLMDCSRNTSLARSSRIVLGAAALATAVLWVGIEAFFVRVDAGGARPSVLAGLPEPRSAIARVELVRELPAPRTEHAVAKPAHPVTVRRVRPTVATGAEASTAVPSPAEAPTEVPAIPTSIEPALEPSPSVAVAETPHAITTARPDPVRLPEPVAAADTPWQATARAGGAIGRASRTAAVGTAGFFTRVSKSVAARF